MKQQTKNWIRAAGIWAVKTICQTSAALIGTAVTMGGVDWRAVLSASMLAGILSILTSAGGIPEVSPEKGKNHTI